MPAALTLNDSQTKALEFARANGGIVYCGHNIGRNMMQIRVAAGTLRVLERLGLGKCAQELGSGQLYFQAD